MNSHRDILTHIRNKKSILPKMSKLSLLLAIPYCSDEISELFSTWLRTGKGKKFHDDYIQLKTQIEKALDQESEDAGEVESFYESAILDLKNGKTDNILEFFNVFPNILDFFHQALFQEGSVLDKINDAFIAHLEELIKSKPSDFSKKIAYLMKGSSVIKEANAKLSQSELEFKKNQKPATVQLISRHHPPLLMQEENYQKLLNYVLDQNPQSLSLGLFETAHAKKDSVKKSDDKKESNPNFTC